MICDTGCSKTCVGFKNDFKPGSLVPLDYPLPMDGVAGTLFATHKGILQYELLNDEGGLTTLETQGLYVPKLECRLFSPQDLFGELWEQGGEEGTLEVKFSACVLKLPNQGPVTISFDPVTHLPIIQAFKSTNKTALTLSIVGCVTDEQNQNLFYLQKFLLQ